MGMELNKVNNNANKIINLAHQKPESGKSLNPKKSLSIDTKSEEYQKQLRKVSEEFAAWYIYEVFKKMYNTVPKSGLIQESFGERWFREMLLQQYALKAARTDLKELSDMIYRSLGGKVIAQETKSENNVEKRLEVLQLLNSLISNNQESGE
ncbi:rod-binding protein [Fervidobacterium pennivorans subsp. shakshaketiis]|jgi:Rod binding domain-containing protein|uniref:rod-binding protein n=1 Tax=Fervidobacterium pennivorans TaxID=93466 RepID=UPI0014368050|nr:rod-binding protein [Fervidobacterium pennivorans]QIV78446.1 rod-binding protein [Fervidobacterium pennivorans subsp. keratinolyticus]